MLGRAQVVGEWGDRVQDLVARGAGRSILVVGEAGIGKSSVLDRVACAAIEESVRVLRVAGVESECDRAWVAVGDLLRPLSAQLPELTTTRIDALRAVLDLEGPLRGEVDPFDAALALLDLVAAAAADRPLVLLVDDLQWLDQSSRRAITHLARRLAGHRVLLVGAQRTRSDTVGFDDVIELAPLDREAANALLLQLDVTAVDVRRQLIDDLGGNPLLLGEVAHVLTGPQRSGRDRLPIPLPLPGTSRLSLSQRLVGLPADTLRALVVVAADPTGSVALVLDALGELGLGVTDLEPAEEQRVVVLDDAVITFVHPSLRSAAYHDRPGPERRRAHAALASVTPASDPRRPWHLAGAAVGPDEAVAVALDQLGELEEARGAASRAAVAFERAARLSPDPAGAAIRLRRAADALAGLGDVDSVAALVDHIAGLPADPAEHARLEGLRGQVLSWQGHSRESSDVLQASARGVATSDPDLAAAQLFAVAANMVRTIDVPGLLEVAGALHDLLPGLSAANALRAEVVDGFALLAHGNVDEGMRQVGRHRELIAAESVIGAAPFLAEVVAPCLAYLVRAPEARTLLDELEVELRARGALAPLVSTLSSRAMLEQTHDLRASIAASQEALHLAEAIGKPAMAQGAALVLSVTSAQAGEGTLCRQHAAWMQAAAMPFAERVGRRSLGLYALGIGDLDAALEEYEALRDRCGFGEGVQRWEPELVEVLFRLRRPGEARSVLNELEGHTDLASSLAGPLSRCRGMLAKDETEASDHFHAGVARFTAVSQSVGIARTELAWGERLRRIRRRAEARSHLQAALDGFARLGAVPWAARAATELRAAGGSLADAVSPGRQLLTAQEQEIARLVGTGATNREVAAILFISPRTVETHVTSIFRKTGVRSRRDLVAQAAREPRTGS